MFILNITKKQTSGAQNGQSSGPDFSFDYLTQLYIGYFTLQTGDLIFTGTPAGVGTIDIE
ncbi:MAG: hypothetical protein IPN46_16945 [Saprospiraceae bacterium]|nr:hypothetical protein [Saprospiraceae bacterium]